MKEEWQSGQKREQEQADEAGRVYAETETHRGRMAKIMKQFYKVYSIEWIRRLSLHYRLGAQVGPI